ncbi:4858_t:CDS:2, partial [Gigaspora margarita]
IKKKNTKLKKFLGWNNTKEIELSCSIVNKEKIELTLLTIEEESPIVDEIKTNEYKIFISYRKFKEYLLKKKIISSEPVYYSKEKQLKKEKVMGMTSKFCSMK